MRYLRKIEVCKDPNIRILGLSHGFGGYGLGRHYHGPVSEILSGFEGSILTEGRQKTFLPPEYAQRAISIRMDSLTKLVRYGFEKYRGIRIGAKILDRFGKRFSEMEEEEEVKTTDLPKSMLEKKQEYRKFKWLSTFLGFRKDHRQIWGVMTNLQSLYISGKIIEHAMAGKPVIAVVGEGHTGDIKRFIDKPEFALEYIRKLRKIYNNKPTDAAFPTEEINADLNATENNFKIWLKMAKNKKK